MPPVTPEVRTRLREIREFQLALLEATNEVSAVLARCELALDAYRQGGSVARRARPIAATPREPALSDGRA